MTIAMSSPATPITSIPGWSSRPCRRRWNGCGGIIRSRKLRRLASAPTHARICTDNNRGGADRDFLDPVHRQSVVFGYHRRPFGLLFWYPLSGSLPKALIRHAAVREEIGSGFAKLHCHPRRAATSGEGRGPRLLQSHPISKALPLF